LYRLPCRSSKNRLYSLGQVDILMMIAFWDVVLCKLIEIDWYFRGAYCLHCQGDESDGGGSTHIWNVGILHQDYTPLCPRRLSSSYSS
jgi:hypothetical protein